MTDQVAVQHRVPPYVLIAGPEQVLAERGLAQTIDDLKVTAPDLETIRLYAAAYTPGELLLHASPSLFGGAKCIVVHDLDEAAEDLQADLLAALAGEPEPDLTLVVTHKGGARGKKVLDTLKGSGARVIDAPAIKTDRDKADFAAHEFRRARRKATAEAVHALVEAVGKDVRELAAACQQLVDDTTGGHRREGRRALPRGSGRGDRLQGRRRGGHDRCRPARRCGCCATRSTSASTRCRSSPSSPSSCASWHQGRVRAGRGRSAPTSRVTSAWRPWQVDKARRSLQRLDGRRAGP
jgi:hypothetical protein